MTNYKAIVELRFDCGYNLKQKKKIQEYINTILKNGGGFYHTTIMVAKDCEND